MLSLEIARAHIRALEHDAERARIRASVPSRRKSGLHASVSLTYPTGCAAARHPSGRRRARSRRTP